MFKYHIRERLSKIKLSDVLYDSWLHDKQYLKLALREQNYAEFEETVLS